MECENIFCIYQSNGKCIIENISIDNSGMCKDCIYPNMDNEMLKNEKNKALKNMISF